MPFVINIHICNITFYAVSFKAVYQNKNTLMDMYVRVIDFAPFYDFSIRFWNCSDSGIFFKFSLFNGYGFFLNWDWDCPLIQPFKLYTKNDSAKPDWFKLTSLFQRRWTKSYSLWFICVLYTITSPILKPINSD